MQSEQNGIHSASLLERVTAIGTISMLLSSPFVCNRRTK